MATQFDPSKPLSPDQAQGVLEQVAEVLGLTSWSDYDGMLQILEMLYQDTGHSHPDAPDDGSEKEVQEDSRDPHAIDHPVVDDDKQRPQRPGRPLPKPQKTLGLTPAQLKICKQQGCTPEAFLAAKRAIGGDQTHIAARLHRQGAAAAKVRR